MQEYYDQLITTSVEDVRQEYATAMKQAILDYVLSHPLERQRLGLQGLQPLLVPRGPAATGAAAGPHSHGSCAGVLGPRLVPASHAALVQRQLPPEWREHVAMARCGTQTGECTLCACG